MKLLDDDKKNSDRIGKKEDGKINQMVGIQQNGSWKETIESISRILGPVCMEASQPAYPGQPAPPGSRLGGLAIVKWKNMDFLDPLIAPI